VTGRLGGVSGLDQQFPGLVEKDSSGLGENNSSLVADEERNAKVVFKLADLPAQRRLGNVQFLRGLAEIKVFSYCEKVANVS
jgi:hypothetical protein